MSRKIIAFYGYKGCGKSEAADVLVREHGFVRHSFATPLKNMLKTLGLQEAQLWGNQKETPCELLGGKTARWAMQSLGTEWGRDCIDPDLWARAWRESLPEGNVVVDDLRFPNEVQEIDKAGGLVVKIERSGYDGMPPTGLLQRLMVKLGLGRYVRHESERYVDVLQPHFILPNNGTLEEFYSFVREASRSEIGQGYYDRRGSFGLKGGS